MTFVLAVGILNLALGYFAAMALAEPPPWAGWRLLGPGASRRNTHAAADVPLAAPANAHSAVKSILAAAALPAGTPATIVSIDDLPRDWLDQLAGAGIVAQSFVEGTAHVLRLEVNRYREQMVTVESRIRSIMAASDSEGLRILSDDLRFLNQDWLDKQTAAADMLAQRAGCLGDHEQAAAALEQVLLDQASNIRTACTLLESPDAPAEPELRGKQLLEQISLLLVPAHALRDRMLDLLAALLAAGKGLESQGAVVQLDQATGLPNRIGLELLLANWWREDPQRMRLLSVVLVDFDRFMRINQRLGTRSGDKTVGAVAGLIVEGLATDRGVERLVRVGGQSLLIVLGDNGPRQALATAERLRQSVEATTFDDEGTEFELTVSCGVVEAGRNETVAELIRRASETLVFAKKSGRNRCALDEGQGPTVVDPPQFPVKGRIINLDVARALQPAGVASIASAGPKKPAIAEEEKPTSMEPTVSQTIPEVPAVEAATTMESPGSEPSASIANEV